MNIYRKTLLEEIAESAWKHKDLTLTEPTETPESVPIVVNQIPNT